MSLVVVSLLAVAPSTTHAFSAEFDITKPLIIGWADRQGGPWGVMLDDIFAGIFAALGVMALAALYHGVL